MEHVRTPSASRGTMAAQPAAARSASYGPAPVRIIPARPAQIPHQVQYQAQSRAVSLQEYESLTTARTGFVDFLLARNHSAIAHAGTVPPGRSPAS